MTPYTLTIRQLGGEILNAGPVRPDEGWQAALLRLYHDVLPEDQPRRAVLSYHAWPGERFDGVATVTLGLRALADAEAREEVLIVDTDPPQFSAASAAPREPLG